MLARLATLLLLLIAVTVPAHAGWEANGGSICYASHSQIYPEIVPDGTGGAVVAWVDSRDGPGTNIYAQRVTAEGAPVWALQGVPVCTAVDDQEDIVMVGDGAGGAFIAWADFRSETDWDIYVQHVGADGSPSWTVDGVAVADADAGQNEPCMVGDGAGGVILVWQDGRNYTLGYSSDIYGQRLDADGVAQWTAGGKDIVSAEWASYRPDLLADGAGGAWLAWEDNRFDDVGNDRDQDIFAGHLDAAGAHAFAPVMVIGAIYNQTEVQLALGPAGGVLLFWKDNRLLGGDIYGSAVSATGLVRFPDDTAVPILEGEDTQILADVVTDDADGAYVFFYYSDLPTYDLRMQRVDGDLTRLWVSSGVGLCNAPGAQTFLNAIPDGSGGALAVWQDTRNADQNDLYAQRIDGTGSSLWGANGQAVCLDSPAHQIHPVLCGDGHGGAIMAWSDQRLGTPGDIWGHHVDHEGDLVPVRVPWQQAAWRDGAVEVSWRLTGGEATPHWLIERAAWPGGAYVSLSVVAMADGADRWTLRDATVEPDRTYTYRVSLVGSPVPDELFVTDPITVPRPATALLPPYPNPCNPGTRVAFTLAEAQHVELAVFDAAGRRVATLVNGTLPAGSHTLDWNGRGADGRVLAAGTYLVRLAGDRTLSAQKLQLVR